MTEWKTAAGEVIPIPALTDGHLANIGRFLLRRRHAIAEQVIGRVVAKLFKEWDAIASYSPRGDAATDACLSAEASIMNQIFRARMADPESVTRSAFNGIFQEIERRGLTL